MQNITFLLSLASTHFQRKHQIRHFDLLRKSSDIFYDVQTVLSALSSKLFRFKSLSTNKLLVVFTVYELRSSKLTYICQALCEASPIINVTHRSFAVFRPIMYVTHRFSAAPAPAIRHFFWLYHTYSLLRGDLYNASTGFGPACGGKKHQWNTKWTFPRKLHIFTREGNMLWLHNKSRLWKQADLVFNGVYIINRILHARAWIWILSSRGRLNISLVRCAHSRDIELTSRR